MSEPATLFVFLLVFVLNRSAWPPDGNIAGKIARNNPPTQSGPKSFRDHFLPTTVIARRRRRISGQILVPLRILQNPRYPLGGFCNRCCPARRFTAAP